MHEDQRSSRNGFRDAISSKWADLGLASGQARDNELHLLESRRWTQLSFDWEERTRLQPLDRMFHTDHNYDRRFDDNEHDESRNNYYCAEHNIEFGRFNDFDQHNRIHHYIEPDDDFKRRLNNLIERHRDLLDKLA